VIKSGEEENAREDEVQECFTKRSEHSEDKGEVVALNGCDCDKKSVNYNNCII